MVFKSRAQVTRMVLSVLISTQISLQPLISHGATSNALPQARSTSVDKSYGEVDPIWQEFAEARDANFQISFDSSDPALDQDPFFMRSQRWVGTTKLATELAFSKSGAALNIAVPNSPNTLQLALPLTPFHASDEFIFLSADSSSTLFEKAAGKGTEAGEGFFFINRADLAASGIESKQVPVHFFPLAGHGWKGELTALEMAQADLIVIANKTESVAIELKDIETAMKAQQINLLMAASMSAKNRAGSTEVSQIAPGMTASFGLFFTGIDLQMPEKSVWKPDQTASFTMKHPVVAAALRKLTNMMPFASVQKANAFDLAPEVIERVMYVGSILTAMLATSVVVKYAHPGVRKKITALRGADAAITGKNKAIRGLKIAGREVKETFDVFAGMTTTAAQFASVTFANSLELFLDRWAPTVAAANHSVVRRFLNNSYYFSRNSVKGVPVNAKTFYLGALVMGTVDTAMVVLQYTVAVPAIANAVAPHMSESMQARIEHTFDPNNPNTNKVVINDSVRNGLAHINGGASSYSQESRQQVIEMVTKEVENSMKARGLDPMKPQNESLKEREIEQKINISMKQRGLPGSEQFLFDASSIFGNIPKALGYKAPADLQAHESFILANRFGLTKNALSKAILTAKKYQVSEGSQVSQEVLSILQGLEKDMSFLVNGIKNGKEGIETARRTRMMLTLLSYEGSIDYAVKYIPEAWTQKFSPEAAQYAALIFRQSLYSYLLKEGDSILAVQGKDFASFSDKARENVLAVLREAHPEDAVMANAALIKKHSYEYTLRLNLEINELARAQESFAKADTYTPPKGDWLTRRQQARAEKEATEKLDLYLKFQTGVVTEAQASKWKQDYYKDALAKQIGLHIENKDVAAKQGREDYVKMIEFVEKNAETTTENEMMKDANLARYLEKATEGERMKIKLNLYANNYFGAYKEATTDLEMVKPTDPAQPGRWQKLRQTEVVRNNAFLTRTLRTFESFGDDQFGLKTGIQAALARNVPLFQDMWASHRRLLKVIAPALTVGYAMSYYAWQVHMPFASLAMLVMTSAATISTPSQWLNRAFRMNGIKAMGGVWSKIGYALPFAWVTFAGMFPVMMYSADLGHLINDYARDPIMGVFGQVPKDVWLKAAVTAGLITVGLKAFGKKNFAERVDTMKQLVNGKPVAVGAGGAISCGHVFLK